MSRQKLPLRAAYRQVAHTPNHEFPFHFVGMIEGEGRHVITGLTNEQAKECYEKLGEMLASNGTEPTE
jgi:hypothetical protein